MPGKAAASPREKLSGSATVRERGLFASASQLTESVFAVVDCGALPNLENGAISLLEGRTTHGALADYACNDNYTLMGDTKRRCGDGGIWSGHQPRCLCKWNE